MGENERHQEQLERMRDAASQKSERARAEAEQHSLEAADRPQEQTSVRAKSSGHKKKTADKWNQ